MPDTSLAAGDTAVTRQIESLPTFMEETTTKSEHLKKSEEYFQRKHTQTPHPNKVV